MLLNNRENIAIQGINGTYKFRWQAAAGIKEDHVPKVCQRLFSCLFVFVEYKIIHRQDAYLFLFQTKIKRRCAVLILIAILSLMGLMRPLLLYRILQNNYATAILSIQW